MSTGSQIKTIRKKKGLTQKQLGDLCGMADSAIRRYESDRGNPTEKTIKKIASALEVDPYSLMDFDMDTKALGGRLRVKDRSKEWKSNKAGRLYMSIDSDLLDLLEQIAKEDGLSLEDEIEKILHEDVEARFDEDLTEDHTEPPEDKK